MRQDVKFSGDSEENMGSYKWRHKVADHRFCKTCGSSIMIDLRRPEIFGETDPRKDMVGINRVNPSISMKQENVIPRECHSRTNAEQVRNFKNIDLDALSYTYFDGKNLI
ncbi:hypothetical protein H4I96_00196 [Botrytis cinerea]